MGRRVTEMSQGPWADGVCASIFLFFVVVSSRWDRRDGWIS